MAQVVGYYDDNVIFNEGPFVICNPLGNGWRIECEIQGSDTPTLPDSSIYRLKRDVYGLNGKTMSRVEIERVCDGLNQMVRDGEIALEGKCWIHKPWERDPE